MKKIFTLFLLTFATILFVQNAVASAASGQPAGKEEVVIWQEGFEPANDTGALPEGWTQKKSGNAIGNDLVDLETGNRQWLRFSELYPIYEDFHPEYIRTGEAAMHINWNVEVEQNVYAITPVLTLPEAEEMSLGFWMYFSSAYHTELNVLLELDGVWEVLSELNSTDHANLYDSEVLIDLTGKVGEARIAFVYKWTDGIQMTIDDIRVFGIAGPTENYDVTFNVDMSAVEGFDPETHHVWVTGSFTDWAEPGTEDSVEMTLVGSKDTPPFTLSESFEGFADWTTDLSPWVTLQVTTGPTYGSENFDFPGAGEEWAWKAFNPSGTDPAVDATHPAQEGSKYAIAVQYQGQNDDKWLISPEVSINETSELSFWGKSITDQYGMERIQVLVSTTDTETGSFTKISDGEYIEVPTTWTEYTFDLSAYAGETIHFAIRYMSFDAFIFMLDNIQLTAESGPQELIYTATVSVPAGEIAYKYFSDLIDEGFDGGEWTGDPNRIADITEATTLNDIFGQQPNVSVEDVIVSNGISVYPNPASEILNIKSQNQIDYLRVFDLSGRMVFNADVMDLNATIDVRRFNNGIYILQLISGQEVKTHKIQVVK